MGDQTQNKRAASPRGNRASGVTRLASLGIVVAGFVAFSSAPAKAGFRYFSADNSVINSNPPATFYNASAEMEFSKLSNAFLNPVGDPTFASSRFFTTYAEVTTPGSIIGVGFGDGDPISQVSNSIPPASSTPPLLIPVPTAISSGLCGLFVLALLAAPRRLRRRLFQ